MNQHVKFVGVLLFALILALFLGIVVGQSDLMALVAVFGIAAGLVSIAEPRVLPIAALVLYNSGLTIPQFEGKLNLFHVAAAGVTAMALLRMTMSVSKRITWSMAHSCLAAFMAVILGTMFVRGAGLKVLGDVKWGGMFYVQLLLCALLVFSMPLIVLPVKAWRPLLTLSALASFFPAIAGYFMIASGGFARAFGGFIQADEQVLVSLSAQQTGGLVRQTAFAGAGQAIMGVVLYFVPIRRLLSISGLKVLPLVVFAFVMVGLSGYRTAFISIFMLILVLMAWNKILDLGRLLLIIGTCVLFYCAILAFSTSLPPNFQRMISVLPGVEVEGYVAADAETTVEWRFLLWEKALTQIPQYWLIGKGYAFSSSEVAFAQNQTSGLYSAIDWAVVTSSYHQGILSLLIGLGIPGLVFGLALYLLFVRRHVQLQSEEWAWGPLKLCHQVITAGLIAGLIQYIFIYGDVQVSFPGVFVTIAMLESMWASNQQEVARRKALASALPAEPAFRSPAFSLAR